MEVVILSLVIALYTTILLGMEEEEECSLSCMIKVVVVSLVIALYIHNTTWNGGGLFINALECTSTSRIHFTNVSFQFNKLLDQLNIYRSALLLLNIENVIFDQIDISNHNVTGLMCINSPIMFDGYSTFVSNSGINGGGIA